MRSFFQFMRPAPNKSPKTKRSARRSLTAELLECRLAPAQFAIIGDYGNAGAKEQSVSALVHSWNPDFIATTSDNNYPYGMASTIDANVGQYYHDFISPYNGSYGAGATTNKFWPAPGAHDWGDGFEIPGTLQPYLNYFRSLPNNGRYYDVTLEGGLVQLFVLDSVSNEPDGTSSTSVQAQWLQNKLASSTATWKLVIDAFPPYSSGSHGSTTSMRWPFQAWGATAVISGHAHNYERLVEDNNFPYFVNGLGGAEFDSFPSIVAGSQMRFTNTNGAMLVNADNYHITFQFITVTGAVIDSYSLFAVSTGATPPPAYTHDLSGPTNLTATLNHNNVEADLSWTDNSSNEAGFAIERSTDGVTFTQVGNVAPNVTTYADMGLAPATQYFYRVCAYNAYGNSPYATAAGSITTYAVAAPTNLTATPTASATEIDLAWTNNATNADSTTLQRSTDGVDFTVVATLPGTAVSYADTGLTPGTTYYYRVYLSNAQGNSLYSNTAVASTTAPAAPTNLTATLAGASTTGINLAWTLGDANATSQTVLRSTDGINFSAIATPSGTATSYADTGLTAGTTYYYEVSSSNAVGTSPYAGPVSVATYAYPAPSGLTWNAAPSGNEIDLSWVNNTGMAASITIQRATGAPDSESSSPADLTFATIGSVAGTATTYADTAVSPFTSYYYRVQAVGPNGVSAYSSLAHAITPSLPAPTGLTVTVASTSELDLSWISPADNVTGYTIQRWNSGTSWNAVATVTGTSYSDTGLAANTQYFYRVYAITSTGTSAYSTQVGSTTAAPLAPSTLVATVVSASQINLTWTDRSNNESGFNIERSTDGVNYTQIIVTAPGATGYGDTGLAANTTYYYRVRASNGAGFSTYTNVASTITSVPAAPSNLSGSAASTSEIDLSWTNNALNQTGFKVERSPNGSTWTQLATVAANVTTYNDTGLSANTQYYYRVRASNALGDSAYSNTATSLTAAPAAPSNLTASAISTSQINLSWTNNAINQSGFKIEQSTDNVTFTQVALVAGTSYSNTGLAASTRYYYRVRATNGVGDSGYSNVANDLTALPAAPTSLVLTVASSSEIDLAWADNSSNETGFKIERWQSGSSWTQIGTVAANVTTYSSTGLVANTQYYYQVRAYNGVGNSAYTNQAGATTLAPPAPSNLAALAVSTSQINLTWQNTNPDQLGVKIERWQSGSTWTQIASVGASATSYSDSGLATATTYYYRVRDYTASANSTYSNQVSAATLAPPAPSNLTANAFSSSQINLVWQNNDPNQLGVKIERWSSVNPAWTQIATVGAAATTYSDTGLVTATKYYYRVRAYEQTTNSAYSSQASATTGTATTGQQEVNDASLVVNSAPDGTVGWSANLGGPAGTLGVYAQDLASPDELARIQDAMDTLNRIWDGSIGFSLVLVNDLSQASIIVHDAVDSAGGSRADGVLGVTELSYTVSPGGNQDNGHPYLQMTGHAIVTVIDGWNWYTGSPQDGTPIAPDQYDYQTVVEHELGHAVGLFHDVITYGSLNGDGHSVMFPVLNASQIRHHLSSGDVAWLDHLYAAGTNPGVTGEVETVDDLMAGDFQPASQSTRPSVVDLVSKPSTVGIPVVRQLVESPNALSSSTVGATLVGPSLAVGQVSVILVGPSSQFSGTIPAPSLAASAETAPAAAAAPASLSPTMPLPAGIDLGSGAGGSTAQTSDDEQQDAAAPDLGIGAEENIAPASYNIASTVIGPEDYVTAFSMQCQRADTSDSVSGVASWRAEADAYFTDQGRLNSSRHHRMPVSFSSRESLVSSYEAEPLMFALMLAAYGGRHAGYQPENPRRNSQVLLRDKSPGEASS